MYSYIRRGDLRRTLFLLFLLRTEDAHEETVHGFKKEVLQATGILASCSEALRQIAYLLDST